MIKILTYQDLQAIPDTDADRAEFVRKVISEHKDSDLYKMAQIADDYERCRNTTIMQYEKTLIDVTGQIVRDRWSPNHKSTSNFFNIFVTQLNQYLLANGVNWKDESTGAKLGLDFDTRLQQAGKAALCGGVAFGFLDAETATYLTVEGREKTYRLKVFDATEFAPLYDEETGALAAGVRFWQIDRSKPIRATLYMTGGYIEYTWQQDPKKAPDSAMWTRIDDNCYMIPKRPYSRNTTGDAKDKMDGTIEIVDGEPAEEFPIVPLWGNPHRQSELIGMREKIDAYDMILNGYENDLDNAKIFWIIKGAGGMDDIDLARFLDRLRTAGAAAPADDQDVMPVPVQIPYEARERLLERLEQQLYKDAMILNPADIAAGAATATQIRAAYEPMNVKADQFEYCVIDFIQGILKVAGIEDEPSFTRSTIVNVQEEVQTVIMAAPYVGDEYVTRKVLTLMGDGDQAEEILRQIEADSMERMGMGDDTTGGEKETDADAAIDEAEEIIGKALNGSQTSSLITVISRFQEGVLSEAQAVKIISTAIGISKEDARAILLGED